MAIPSLHKQADTRYTRRTASVIIRLIYPTYFASQIVTVLVMCVNSYVNSNLCFYKRAQKKTRYKKRVCYSSRVGNSPRVNNSLCVRYSFSAPESRPAAAYFCVNANIVTVGAMDMTVPALSSPHLTSFFITIELSATGIV